MGSVKKGAQAQGTKQEKTGTPAVQALARIAEGRQLSDDSIFTTAVERHVDWPVLWIVRPVTLQQGVLPLEYYLVKANSGPRG